MVVLYLEVSGCVKIVIDAVVMIAIFPVMNRFRLGIAIGSVFVILFIMK